MVAAVARRQGKEPTATLTASSFDLDQFGGQGPSLPALMARYDRIYALEHAATLILAVGAIYILLDACEPLPLFHRTIRKTFSGFRRGAGVCVAWCRFNAFMTAIRFAGGRLYAWICVIEFQSLVRDNFDRVGTYKKVFGSFGLMDVKRGGVGSILTYPMSQGSETRVYLSRHQRSRRVSQVR